MEQEVVNYGICCACLSLNRTVTSINSLPQIYTVFKFIMSDFIGDGYVTKIEPEQLVCWECRAIMMKFAKFKKQVHNVQQNLQLAIQQSKTPTFKSNSLSSLTFVTKNNFDGIFVNYSDDLEEDVMKNKIKKIPLDTNKELTDNFKKYDVAQTLRDNIILGIEKKEVTSEADYSDDPLFTETCTREPLPELTIDPTTNPSLIISTKTIKQENNVKPGYTTIFMSEADIFAAREISKQNEVYTKSNFKCELCIIGFDKHEQLVVHYNNMHEEKPNHTTCKICYTYIEENKLKEHINKHHWRYICKMCNKSEGSVKLITRHVKTHVNNIKDCKRKYDGDKKKPGIKQPKELAIKAGRPKKTDLRKLGSKTTIVGYACPECHMVFKNTTARMMHVARFHTEGFICDHCKKKFANRNSLITHLKLHQGPLPREECPICHKMVRRLQLRYHIRRHQNTTRYECKECKKVYQDLVSYQGHLKYSRLHGTDEVFKFPCPMCNKGYPTKQAMQDHFNYQHLGKTTHKCPVCSKPLASKRMVEQHVKRAHTEKQPKPRNHICQQCGKAFYEKKCLIQHEAIHTGERPLSCDICHMTFRQKASLYTHKKRVHKIFPVKKRLEFIEKD